MTYSPKFLATIKDGKIVLDNPERLKNYLQSLKTKEIEITVGKRESLRSLRQNAYYWAYLGIISDATGDIQNDLHEYFKRALLPPRFIKVRGKEIKIPATTTKLDKKQFGDYLERICACTNIPIPDIESIDLGE